MEGFSPERRGVSFLATVTSSLVIGRLGCLTTCLTGSADSSADSSDSSCTVLRCRFLGRTSVRGDVGGVKKRGVGGVTVSIGGVEELVEGEGKVNTCAVGGVGEKLGVFLSRTTTGFGGGIYNFILGISGASSQSLSESSSLSNFS